MSYRTDPRRDDEDRSEALWVTIDGGEATIADLRVAIDPDAGPGPLLVDGRLRPAATPLGRAGLADGCTVTPPHGPAGRAHPPPVVIVTVRAGPDAGRRIHLPAGRHLVGRAGRPHRSSPVPDPTGTVRVADPTVSDRHLVLHAAADGSVTIVDLGSTNGTRLGGSRLVGPHLVGPHLVGPLDLRLGRSVIRIQPAPPHPPAAGPAPSGRGPVAEDPAVDVTPPEPAPVPTPPPPLGLTALLISFALGAGLVVVLHSWTATLFAALGPTLVLANAADGRVRAHRQRRTEHQRWATARAGFEQRSRQASRAWADGLDRAHPAVAPIVLGDVAPVSDGDAGGSPISIRLGTGRATWPLPWPDPARLAVDLRPILARVQTVDDAPLIGRLERGTPFVLAGPTAATRAAARSIVVQVVAGHGPQHLRLAVLAAPGSADGWDWCAWLPHVRRQPAEAGLPGPPWQLAATPEDQAALVSLLAAAIDRAPDPRSEPDLDPDRSVRWLVVVDGPAVSAVEQLGQLLAHQAVTSLVVSESRSAERSRTGASASVAIGADGTISEPEIGIGTVDGLSPETAARWAQRVARAGAAAGSRAGGLPDVVALADLDDGPADRYDADPPPIAVLGRSAEGPVTIDLAADGPHLLIAGTTGSGKSELLRTLVLSLAQHCGPDHLAFVLMDFKGGAAFDACLHLPHTVGVVTDLDEALAARVLRSLEAEIRGRERALRRSGAADLRDHRRRGGPALPRIVVVIDEFATVAAALPTVLDGLVALAQRGRSLGLHLVLATQRPRGAVAEPVRANIGLRLALRLEDEADSRDILDSPAAAWLPRDRPGRAILRYEAGRHVTFQAATTMAAARDHDGAVTSITVEPLAIRRQRVAELPAGSSPASSGASGSSGSSGSSAGPDCLAGAVAATREAWAAVGQEPARPIWTAPLPSDVAWPIDGGKLELSPGVAEDGLALGVADDPDGQRRIWCRWAVDASPLLLAGRAGQGTSTAAATAVLAAAARWGPEEVHIHIVDHGGRRLAALADLPQVGTVIDGEDEERQRRLLGALAAELARRRADPLPSGPRVLLIIDGIGPFRSAWADQPADPSWARFADIASRGTAQRVHLLTTAAAPTEVPPVVLASSHQRLVLDLSDPGELATLGGRQPANGVRPGRSSGRPGRAVDITTGLIVQLARPDRPLAEAVATLARAHDASDPRGWPRPVGHLPDEVYRSEELDRASQIRGEGTLLLALGLADGDLGPAVLTLASGGHAFIVGPPRSGRTTTLASLAEAGMRIGATVVAITGLDDAAAWPAGTTIRRRDDTGPADRLPLGRPDAPVLVLVDDADLLADDHPVLRALTDVRSPHRHLVAGARADRLRASYRAWWREVRADRVGLLLQPDLDLDGDLLGIRLPRALPRPPGPGRGWLVGGNLDGLIQVARPVRP